MNKIIFWIIIFLVSIGIIYLISDTLAPFLISFIFAYLLQPIIDNNYQRFKLPRGVVVFCVFTIFVSSFVIITLIVVPIIYQQIAIFVKNIPHYKKNFDEGISYWSDSLNNIDPEFAEKLTDAAQNFINSVFSIFASLANHLWQYTLATINFFTIIALVPIILYYFLYDWSKITHSIKSILPVRGQTKMKEIFTSINDLLSAYIRGQLNICLILTLYYIIGLYIIGFDIALLLGIISGFLVIIPFIGTLISLTLVAVSCYFSFGIGVEFLYVSILFVFGHTVEGYILTPKIIGNRIGLHPVWIIFAVFTAGSLLGIWGIIFAIPIAAIVKLLLGHLIEYYKSTDIYKS